MVGQSEIIQQAKAFSKEQRKKILMSLKEIELHKHLKELFKAMEPDYTIEITHGPEELGKDIVIVKKDKIGIDVIGVVVKTGDIRAKTLGKVDELKTQAEKAFSYAEEKKIKNIESQVQQAFAHPAEMKMIFKKLPISKVFIVLAGELSKQARKRLDKELTENVEIKDINWLIEKFTKYYPQVFFEGRVIDFLQEKIQQLETEHWLSKRGINLSDYFVGPPVTTIDIPVTLNEENFALIIEKRRMPFSLLKSILTPTRKIILVGDPGVGKSSALAKLSIDMLKEASALMFRGASKRKIEIPILVSAKEILEVDNSEALLKKYLVIPDIIDRFKVQVLMIDALDEVLLTQGKKVIKKAEEISRQLACSLVITSRKIDIINTSPTGFEKYELLPFEYEQALRLFEKLVSSNQILSSLKDGLEKIKFQIPMVPLSLMLLIELVEDNKEIPASVTELYDRFFDLMLGRWDKDKGIKVLFEYFIKRRFLAELAFKEFLEKGKLEISQKEFEVFLNNYFDKYGWDKENSKGFIREIERAGILNIKDPVIFRHRSFLDYSIACYIFDKRTEFDDLNDFVVQTYFDDTWGEVSFFYIGLMREISDAIIEKIFAVEDNGLFTCIDKLLTGRLLQAGWNSPTARKYYGIEKALSFVPVIREKFLKIAGKSKDKIPRIFADYLVMTLSKLAFGSGFLYKEAKSLFNNLSVQLNENSLPQMLSILWAIQGFLTPRELRETIDNFLETLSKIPDLSLEEQARSLLFLMIIEQKDKATVKTIKKKLNNLKKKDPETFKKLLPHKEKGFR
ncbi:hypothetical protein J7K92_00160 [bacterium]|nr:hypothetical protein [bacterium]